MYPSCRLVECRTVDACISFSFFFFSNKFGEIINAYGFILYSIPSYPYLW